MNNQNIIDKVLKDFNKAYPGKAFFTLGQMLRFAKHCLELKDYGIEEKENQNEMSKMWRENGRENNFLLLLL